MLESDVATWLLCRPKENEDKTESQFTVIHGVALKRYEQFYRVIATFGRLQSPGDHLLAQDKCSFLP